MSKALGMRCVWGLCGVLVSVWALASVARAEVSTDVSGSVLVFPKVVWTGFSTNPDLNQARQLERDTVIQISNTSNNMVHAQCYYVNGQLVGGRPLWQVTDFQIWLTRQQPTHFVASQGRPVNPGDGYFSDGSGLDPGAIPPVPDGFEGELKCVQVDASGTPFGGNNLKGEALIRSADGDVSKTNAVAILANPDLAGADPSNELLLDNGAFPGQDGEYNACPNKWLIDHFVDGTPSEVIQAHNAPWCPNGQCPSRTYLTLVPCTQDFENHNPSSVTVQFAIVNELEQQFSASTTVDCWLTKRLADIDAPTGRCSASNAVCLSDQQCIDNDAGFCTKQSVFATGTLGTGSAFTTITPADSPDTNPPSLQGGVIALTEQVQFNALFDSGAQITNRTWAGWNTHETGNRYDATVDLPGGPVIDKITIPAGF